MELHIARIYYPVTTLGPGKRVGIWTSGCNRNCPGCISPELQQFENGRAMTTDEIMNIINSLSELPDGFTISGGEPFADPVALHSLLDALCEISDDIIIFTGYTYEELKSESDADINAVIALCAMLVDGPYIQELNDGMGLRGSSNQRCLIFKYQVRYSAIELEPRELQSVRYGKNFLTIGIP